jgi:uncharacterized membrane protein YebE (DUF533 family)
MLAISHRRETMFDAQRLLGQVLKDAMGGGRRHKRRASLTGLPRGMEAQVGMGLLGVAIAAFEHFRAPANAAGSPGAGPPGHAPSGLSGSVHAATAGAAPPTGMPPPPPPGRPAPAVAQDQNLHLLRIMIAAMHADGAVDAEERRRLLGRAADAGLQGEDLRALEDELWHPRPLDQLLRDTPAQLREQAWIAGLVAIDADEAREHAFLAQLADGLQLDAAQQARIRENLGLPPTD